MYNLSPLRSWTNKPNVNHFVLFFATALYHVPPVSNVHLYSSVTASARETNPNTRALELTPTSPARTKQQARDEHAMRGAQRVHACHHFLLLTHDTDFGLCTTSPNPRATCNHYCPRTLHEPHQRLRTLRNVPEPTRKPLLLLDSTYIRPVQLQEPPSVWPFL